MSGSRILVSFDIMTCNPGNGSTTPPVCTHDGTGSVNRGMLHDCSPGGSMSAISVTVLTQRPESPSCPHKHADIVGPYYYKGQWSSPICPQTSSPISPVDPRWCRHWFRMRVPSPEIYRLPIRASERPGHHLLVAWVRKRKGEPSAPVFGHRRSDFLDPDFPTVEGCRTHQDTERLSCVPCRLPMRTPDANHIIAYVHAPPVSTKTSHTITPRRDRN